MNHEMNIHTWTIAALVAIGVTVGGCHVLKEKPEAKAVAVQTIHTVPAPVLSLQSLDARVKSLEASRAAVRAAAKGRAKASVLVQ